MSRVLSVELSSEFRNPLIYLANLHRWVPLQDCVWDAPSCLKSLHRLANRYQDCRKLFCEILQIGNSTSEQIVNELETLPLSAPIPDRKELLLQLNEHIERSRLQPFVPQFRNKVIVPVARDDVIRIESYDSSEWYLADWKSLRDSFRGKIWLLEFTVEEVRKSSALINAMCWENKLLSTVVRVSQRPVGDPVLDLGLTAKLRERAEYLMR